MAGEIFICYRRSDQAKAQLLHKLLRRRGVDAWYDALLGAGENWREKTAEALAAAPIFVLLFSKAASESNDISKELAAATFSKKMVIPVRIENINPTGAFLYELASRNWFDAYEDTDAKLADLADKLADLVKSGTKQAVGSNPGEPANVAAPKFSISPLLKRPAVLWSGAALLAGILAAITFFPRPTVAKDRVAFFGFIATSDDPATHDIATTATDELFSNFATRRFDIVARGDATVPAEETRLDRASKLGARYALSGEVRRVGEKAVFAMRMEDVTSRQTLWEDTSEGPVATPVPTAFRASDNALLVSSCVLTTAYTDNGGPRTAEALGVVAADCGKVPVDGAAPYLNVLRELAGKRLGGPDTDAALAFFLADGSEDASPAAKVGMLREAEEAFDRAKTNRAESYATAAARVSVAVAKGEPPAAWIPDLEAALQRSPQSSDWYWFGQLNHFAFKALLAVGRVEDAIAYSNTALDVDPFFGPSTSIQIAVLAATDYKPVNVIETWEPQAARLKQTRPDAFVWEAALAASIINGRGDTEALLSDPPDFAEPYVLACYRDLQSGMKLTSAEARRAASRRAEPCLKRWESHFILVQAASTLGDIDTALAQIDTVEEAYDQMWDWYAPWFVPAARAMRADLRFLPLMEALGYLNYWKQTKTKPDICSMPEESDIPLCVALK